MGLKTNVNISREEFVIEIGDKFDFNLISEFKNSYLDIKMNTDGLADQVNVVVVDLRETQYIDSSGLGMLLNMKEALKPHVNTFKLINANESLKKILQISNFQKLFDLE